MLVVIYSHWIVCALPCQNMLYVMEVDITYIKLIVYRYYLDMNMNINKRCSYPYLCGEYCTILIWMRDNESLCILYVI